MGTASPRAYVHAARTARARVPSLQCPRPHARRDRSAGRRGLPAGRRRRRVAPAQRLQIARRSTRPVAPAVRPGVPLPRHERRAHRAAPPGRRRCDVGRGCNARGVQAPRLSPHAPRRRLGGPTLSVRLRAQPGVAHPIRVRDEAPRRHRGGSRQQRRCGRRPSCGLSGLRLARSRTAAPLVHGAVRRALRHRRDAPRPAGTRCRRRAADAWANDPRVPAHGEDGSAVRAARSRHRRPAVV